MAVPKKKVSRSKRDKRRTFDKMVPKLTSLCDMCGQAKLPHRLCMLCGHYKGISFFVPGEAKEKQE